MNTGIKHLTQIPHERISIPVKYASGDGQYLIVVDSPQDLANKPKGTPVKPWWVAYEVYSESHIEILETGIHEEAKANATKH